MPPPETSLKWWDSIEQKYHLSKRFPFQTEFDSNVEAYYWISDPNATNPRDGSEQDSYVCLVYDIILPQGNQPGKVRWLAQKTSRSLLRTVSTQDRTMLISRFCRRYCPVNMDRGAPLWKHLNTSEYLHEVDEISFCEPDTILSSENLKTLPHPSSYKFNPTSLIDPDNRHSIPQKSPFFTDRDRMLHRLKNQEALPWDNIVARFKTEHNEEYTSTQLWSVYNALEVKFRNHLNNKTDQQENEAVNEFPIEFQRTRSALISFLEGNISPTLPVILEELNDHYLLRTLDEYNEQDGWMAKLISLSFTDWQKHVVKERLDGYVATHFDIRQTGQAHERQLRIQLMPFDENDDSLRVGIIHTGLDEKEESNVLNSLLSFCTSLKGPQTLTETVNSRLRED